MDLLQPLAEQIAARLIARKETIAVAESSTGGLIAAALLALPGASAYFVGGAVVYTKAARAALMGIGEMIGMRWVLWGAEDAAGDANPLESGACEIPEDVFENMMRFIERALRPSTEGEAR